MTRWIFSILFFLSAVSLTAQGFDLYHPGVRQMGMASIGISTIPDVSSIYFNPGALSSVQANGVQVGFGLFREEDKASNVAGQVINTVPSSSSQLGHLFGMWSLSVDSPWKIGLGVYHPFVGDYAFNYLDNGLEQQQDYRYASLSLQPTFSYRLTDKLGVGLGLVLGRSSLSWTYAETDLQQATISSEELEADAYGIAWNFGFFWQPSDVVQLGFNYRSSNSMRNATGSLEASGSNGPEFYDLSLNMSTPASWNLGINCLLNPGISVSFETGFVDWRSATHEFLEIPIEQQSPALAWNAVARTNEWVNRFGLEYAVFSRLQLRTGIEVRNASILKGSFHPLPMSTRRIGFSWGASYYFKEKLMIDLAFQLKRGADRVQLLNDIESAGKYQPGSDLQAFKAGTFGHKSLNSAIQFSYRF